MLSPQVGHGKIVPNWQGQKNTAEIATALGALSGAERCIELFGGTGRLTLYNLARRRWWNDCDMGLWRLAVAIRDRPLDLIAELASCDPVEIWATRSKNRMEWPPAVVAVGGCVTFGGRMRGRAHFKTHHEQQWKSWIKRLPEVSRALRGVRMSGFDWREALHKADGWSVYADPPYGTNADSVYATGGIDNDELVQALSEHNGDVVLCGYGDDLPGWSRIEMPRKRQRETQKRSGERFGADTLWVRA